MTDLDILAATLVIAYALAAVAIGAAVYGLVRWARRRA